MRISQIVSSFFQIYFYLIIVRIFLTWIPSIDWSAPFFRAIAVVADCVLLPFRRPLFIWGGFDFSPIIALFVLQIVANAIVYLLLLLGL